MKQHLALVACTLVTATVPAQTIATFDFENLNLSSPQPSFATVSDLQVSNTFVFGGSSADHWLCLTTAWNNSGGTITFTVTPNTGVSIDYEELSWEAVTNSPSTSDSVRAATVRANGNVVGSIDPLTHNTTETVDLTTFAFLEAVAVPVTFEITFVGNPNGQSSYEIGRFRLTGGPCTVACCPNQGTAVVFGTGCAPSSASVPSIVSLSAPQVGEPLRVGIESPSSPNSVAILYYGFDLPMNVQFNMALPIDLGPYGFPGCSVYSSGMFIVALGLDANGRAPFQVTIPPSHKWCDASLVFQGFALTPAGELLATPGLITTLGN